MADIKSIRHWWTVEQTGPEEWTVWEWQRPSEMPIAVAVVGSRDTAVRKLKEFDPDA